MLRAACNGARAINTSRALLSTAASVHNTLIFFSGSSCQLLSLEDDGCQQEPCQFAARRSGGRRPGLAWRHRRRAEHRLLRHELPVHRVDRPRRRHRGCQEGPHPRRRLAKAALPRLLRAGLRRVRADQLDGREHGGEGRAGEPEPARVRGDRPHQGDPGGAVPGRGVLRGHPGARRPRRRVPGGGTLLRRPERAARRHPLESGGHDRASAAGAQRVGPDPAVRVARVLGAGHGGAVGRAHAGRGPLRVVPEPARERGGDAGRVAGVVARREVRRGRGRGRGQPRHRAVRPDQHDVRRGVLPGAAGAARAAELRPDTVRVARDEGDRERVRGESGVVLLRVPAGHAQDGAAGPQGWGERGDQEDVQGRQLHVILLCSCSHAGRVRALEANNNAKKQTIQ